MPRLHFSCAAPWEIVRPEVTCAFGGHTQSSTDAQRRYRVRWIPGNQIKGVACDIPVVGYRVNTCNTLRLWKSEAVESFDFQDLNVGDYYGAVQDKVVSETLSKMLYPNDEPDVGKRLRLAQQYFSIAPISVRRNMARVLTELAEHRELADRVGRGPWRRRFVRTAASLPRSAIPTEYEGRKDSSLRPLDFPASPLKFITGPSPPSAV